MSKTKKAVNTKMICLILMIIFIAVIAWFVYMNSYVQGNYYIINSNGEIISDRGYEKRLGTLAVGDSCLYVFSLSNRFDSKSIFYRQTIFVVDEKGNVVKKGKASEKDGLYYDTSVDTLKYQGRYIFFDENGNETYLAPENMLVKIKGEQNAMDLIMFCYAQDSDEKTLYGYVNRQGEVVIEPQFIYARPFTKEGLAAVQPKDGKVGYINMSGEFIIPPIYDGGFSFSDGIARVEKDEKYEYIDISGNVVLELSNENTSFEYSEGFIRAVDDEGRYAYLDVDGNYVTDFTYDYAFPFLNGIAMVCIDDKDYFIDTSFNTVIEPKYVEACPFSENGLARAKGENGLWGYIDTKGEWVIDPIYSEVGPFYKESAFVEIVRE